MNRDLQQVPGETARFQAAPMRCADHDQPLNVRLRFQKQRFLQARFGLRRSGHFVERLIEIGVPQLVAAIHDRHFADQPAHAVADEHHLAQRRIVAAGIELGDGVSQSDSHVGRRCGDRSAGRVQEQPNLIALGQLRIVLQVVDGSHPRRWAGKNTVNQHDWNFAGTVRLIHVQAALSRIDAIRPKQTDSPPNFETRKLFLDGERRGAIGGERDRAFIGRMPRASKSDGCAIRTDRRA